MKPHSLTFPVTWPGVKVGKKNRGRGATPATIQGVQLEVLLSEAPTNGSGITTSRCGPRRCVGHPCACTLFKRRRMVNETGPCGNHCLTKTPRRHVGPPPRQEQRYQSPSHSLRGAGNHQSADIASATQVWGCWRWHPLWYSETVRWCAKINNTH